MKLEDQVCGLEYGKQLKELGIKQKSLFYWIGIETKSGNLIFGLTYLQLIFQEKDKFKEIYSAFTVAELTEILPPECSFSKYCGGRSGIKVMGYKVSYYEGDDRSKHVCEDTLANASAKMLIYLIENKLITIEK